MSQPLLAQNDAQGNSVCLHEQHLLLSQNRKRTTLKKKRKQLKELEEHRDK